MVASVLNEILCEIINHRCWVDTNYISYFAQTDLAMMPRTSSSAKPSRHQKGDYRQEWRVNKRLCGNSVYTTENLCCHHSAAQRLLEIYRPFLWSFHKDERVFLWEPGEPWFPVIKRTRTTETCRISWFTVGATTLCEQAGLPVTLNVIVHWRSEQLTRREYLWDFSHQRIKLNQCHWISR